MPNHTLDTATTVTADANIKRPRKRFVVSELAASTLPHAVVDVEVSKVSEPATEDPAGGKGPMASGASPKRVEQHGDVEIDGDNTPFYNLGPQPGPNEHRLTIEYLTADQIHPADDQFYDHPAAQKAALVASIIQYGNCGVIRTDMEGKVVDGHLLFEVLKGAGAKAFPVLRLPVDNDQAAHLRIGLNRIPSMAKINMQKFKTYLHKIKPATVRMKAYPESFGVSSVEYDKLMASPVDISSESEKEEPATKPQKSVTKVGDTWLVGNHKVHCGDALKRASYVEVMGNEMARLVVADLPYNVPINGHVSGLGKVKHDEFVQASGEMSHAEFGTFLNTAATRQYEVLVDGGLAYNFMDWRSIDLLCAAGRAVFDEYKQLLVWNKLKGSMGSFYRSQHELIAVFKKGSAPHTNNFRLGETGRYRTNVLDYPGANTFSKTRLADLAAHPTVKPTVLIADLILDVSHADEIVLDPFGGSGTTMLAAEKTGRRARLIELDPRYVDTSIRRFEQMFETTATLQETGQSFAEVAAERLTTSEAAND